METRQFESDHTETLAVQRTLRSSSFIRAVNANFGALSRMFGYSDSVAFLCECGDPGCYAAVWMSATAFDQVATGNSVWLLSAGHEPSTVSYVPEVVRPRVLAPHPVARRLGRSVRHSLGSRDGIRVGERVESLRE